jgi:hypothetical protein
LLISNSNCFTLLCILLEWPDVQKYNPIKLIKNYQECEQLVNNIFELVCDKNIQKNKLWLFDGYTVVEMTANKNIHDDWPYGKSPSNKNVQMDIVFPKCQFVANYKLEPVLPMIRSQQQHDDKTWLLWLFNKLGECVWTIDWVRWMRTVCLNLVFMFCCALDNNFVKQFVKLYLDVNKSIEIFCEISSECLFGWTSKYSRYVHLFKDISVLLN